MQTWTWRIGNESLRRLDIPWPDYDRAAEFAEATNYTKVRNGYANRDRVPFPAWVPALARRVGRVQHRRYRRLAWADKRRGGVAMKHAMLDLRIVAKSATAGHGTRRLAVQLIERYDLRRLKSRRVRNWIALVDAAHLTWDVLEKVEKVERPDVTYDFTVPGKEAFAVDGLYLTHNTMNYHVPASDFAVKETIDKLLPSKNLFSTGDFRVHQLPQREYAAGLYLATRKPTDNKVAKIFATVEDAIKAHERGDLPLDHPVHILRS